MAGGRRRHTRKLVAMTAAVALLAGVTTEVVLTRSPEPSADPRATAATTGPRANDRAFLTSSLTAWGEAQKQPWKASEPVTEVSSPPNVFWTGDTPSGPAALVAQEVRVRNSEHPATLVGLVANNAVTDREVVCADARDREVGLTCRRPVRGAHPGQGGVLVASLSERPVFVRGDTAPRPGDFTQPLIMGAAFHEGAFVAHPGLGWSGQFCAMDPPEQNRMRPAVSVKSAQQELQKRALLDYLASWEATGSWSVCAWLPDGRYALMFETYGELYGVLYQPDGTFSAPVLGGRAVKGEPAVLPLPDGQGTIVADFNSAIGPQERFHAWLAPADTREVTVGQRGVPKVVQLPWAPCQERQSVA